ncbi:uncharacterized protein LOC100679311 [Nasonia vitripennis]|uniref:Uncharacterized protein n=1 Tax=Nasonia vitripennis TaxID=7425 RepID=A0A7M7GBV0_NASVI|nr:uncharacterized protein LOC100679311 [Nasonia vitripennis]
MTRQALRLCLLTAVLLSAASALPAEDYETVRTSNAAILNRLGLIPLVLPEGNSANGHHRKRLAGPEGFSSPLQRMHQSPYGRRHSSGSAHDSHVYVVKLPASPPYYSFSKPQERPNVTVANPNPGFRNNGKPAKIYHWNLPLVKKINEKKKQMALLRMEQARKKMEAERERQKVAEKMNYFKKLAQEQLVGDAQKKPSRNNDKWLSYPELAEARTKNTDNATQLKIFSSTSSTSGEKTYRLEGVPDSMSRNSNSHHHHFNSWHDSNPNNDVHGNTRNSLDQGTRAKKHRKKSAAVSYYYAPAVITGKSASTSISKHFAGNGKPKAFYVMEKSRKPVYYHPLLP